ncbi:MAG TPA: hypothetical protein VL992_06850, partial [Tepidisphaeraceae bacterium]|nr:hypothetical protein [Tepidisphaeraceae bacterium]
HFSGYGLTNESTAFSLRYFLAYWPSILHGLYDQCLYFILPLSVLGSVLMLAADWQLGLLIASWSVPAIVLYAAYYWSPEDGGPATLPYLRFLITVLPALVLAAMWLMHQLGHRLGEQSARLAAGIIVAIALINEVETATAAAAQLQWNSLGGLLVAQEAKRIIPPGSSIFAEGHDMVLLEEIGDWRTYTNDLFTTESIAPLGRVNAGEPQELQPARAAAIYALLGGLSDAQLIAWQNGLMRLAMSAGHGVYAILPTQLCRQFCDRYVNGRGFVAHTILTWRVDGNWQTQFAAPSVTMQLVAIQPN